MRRRIAILAIAASFAACAHRTNPVPTPDAPALPAPDLSSLTVMILPAQAPPSGSSVRAQPGEPVPGLDAEIGFFLAEQAPRVHWVSSDAVKKGAARAQSIHVDPTALSVLQFSKARLRRIGDPLWGDLRLLGEVMNARYAVLPFAAGFAPDSGSVGTGRVEIGAAIIDTGNGNVLWTGYAAGEHGQEGAPAVIASAARELAKRIAH